MPLSFDFSKQDAFDALNRDLDRFLEQTHDACTRIALATGRPTRDVLQEFRDIEAMLRQCAHNQTATQRLLGEERRFGDTVSAIDREASSGLALRHYHEMMRNFGHEASEAMLSGRTRPGTSTTQREHDSTSPGAESPLTPHRGEPVSSTGMSTSPIPTERRSPGCGSAKARSAPRLDREGLSAQPTRTITANPPSSGRALWWHYYGAPAHYMSPRGTHEQIRAAELQCVRERNDMALNTEHADRLHRAHEWEREYAGKWYPDTPEQATITNTANVQGSGGRVRSPADTSEVIYAQAADRLKHTTGPEHETPRMVKLRDLKVGDVFELPREFGHHPDFVGVPLLCTGSGDEFSSVCFCRESDAERKAKLHGDEREVKLLSSASANVHAAGNELGLHIMTKLRDLTPGDTFRVTPEFEFPEKWLYYDMRCISNNGNLLEFSLPDDGPKGRLNLSENYGMAGAREVKLIRAAPGPVGASDGLTREDVSRVDSMMQAAALVGPSSMGSRDDPRHERTITLGEVQVGDEIVFVNFSHSTFSAGDVLVCVGRTSDYIRFAKKGSADECLRGYLAGAAHCVKWVQEKVRLCARKTEPVGEADCATRENSEHGPFIWLSDAQVGDQVQICNWNHGAFLNGNTMTCTERGMIRGMVFQHDTVTGPSGERVTLRVEPGNQLEDMPVRVISRATPNTIPIKDLRPGDVFRLGSWNQDITCTRIDSQLAFCQSKTGEHVSLTHAYDGGMVQLISRKSTMIALRDVQVGDVFESNWSARITYTCTEKIQGYVIVLLPSGFSGSLETLGIHGDRQVELVSRAQPESSGGMSYATYAGLKMPPKLDQVTVSLRFPETPCIHCRRDVFGYGLKAIRTTPGHALCGDCARVQDDPPVRLDPVPESPSVALTPGAKYHLADKLGWATAGDEA